MKRRKKNNIFGTSRHPDHNSGINKKPRRQSSLGISLGSAIASLGMIALSGTAQAAEFWWSGADITNNWSDLNWSATAADSGPVLLGGNADAVFSIIGGGTDLNTNLGTTISISSLRVNEVNPVTINGDPFGTPLTITGTGTIVPLSGINIETGAGLTTINANLDLGVANAQIVIVNNTAGLVVNGDMIGANGLTKQGTGVLTLTGQNTYVGATNVMDGTLQLGDGLTTGSSIDPLSAVTVDALGTLALNLANGETFENSVTNNGRIHWIASGTNTQHATSVFSGLGDMLITAPGTTELLGVNTFTGGTTVNTTGDVLVGNSSAFGSGPLTIIDGYIDTVASQPLQINVGNYDQSGGELGIRLQGPGGAVHTQYNANGTAVINGGTVFLYDASGSYIPQEGDVQTIVQATGVRSGTGFDDNTPNSQIFSTAQSQNIAYRQGNTLLYPTIDYDADSAFVIWVQDSFASTSETSNQNSVGNALDEGAAPTELTDFLNTQDVSALPAMFDLISPDELTSMYQMGFTGSEMQNANIKRHLARVRQGSPRQVQYTQAATDSKGGMVQQQATMMSDASRWSIFAEGFDGSASVDGDSNASGYDFDTRGATVGADLRMSDRLVVGILGSYTEADASLINGGSIEDEAWKGALYATLYDEAFYMDALLGMGRHSYDIERVGLGGIASGSTKGWEIDAMLNTGYDIKSGNWTYGPTASLAYTRIMLDSFSETGSDAPLRFASQNQDSLRSELGAKIAYAAEFGSMRITPEVRLAWQHEFLDSTQSLDASFVGGSGGTFSSDGPSMDKDRFLLGAGLTVQVTPNFSIYGSYDGYIGSSDYDSRQVTAGIKFDF